MFASEVVDLHISKTLFSLDPDNLQLHCSVVHSFVLSTNHVRHCKWCWSPPMRCIHRLTICLLHPTSKQLSSGGKKRSPSIENKSHLFRSCGNLGSLLVDGQTSQFTLMGIDCEGCCRSVRLPVGKVLSEQHKSI